MGFNYIVSAEALDCTWSVFFIITHKLKRDYLKHLHIWSNIILVCLWIVIRNVSCEIFSLITVVDHVYSSTHKISSCRVVFWFNRKGVGCPYNQSCHYCTMGTTTCLKALYCSWVWPWIIPNFSPSACIAHPALWMLVSREISGLFSLCPVTKVWGIFSNQVLSSRRFGTIINGNSPYCFKCLYRYSPWTITNREENGVWHWNFHLILPGFMESIIYICRTYCSNSEIILTTWHSYTILVVPVMKKWHWETCKKMDITKGIKFSEVTYVQWYNSKCSFSNVDPSFWSFVSLI